MIDLHTHTLLSDGKLLPSELVRRAVVKGYRAIALADHADASNVDFVVPRLKRVSKQLNSVWNILVIPAVELTHVPIEYLSFLAKKARYLGAKLILVHGETKSEPVLPGTNETALLSKIDILAHPGFITEKDLNLAVRKNIYLEITTRAGHRETNEHLIKITQGTPAKLILNTDSHAPEDLISKEEKRGFLKELGLGEKRIEEIFLNSEELLNNLGFKVPCSFI